MVTAAGELVFEVTTEKLVSAVFIRFLRKALCGRTRPLLVITDHASYHTSNEVKQFVEDHSQQIRLFFFPPHSPKLNPDEQVWNEIKHRQLEKEPIKNRVDFQHRVYSALIKLQNYKEKIKSFFKLNPYWASKELFAKIEFKDVNTITDIHLKYLKHAYKLSPKTDKAFRSILSNI